MITTQFSESITETLDILKHMEKIYTDKIPQKFKAFLEENKSVDYVPKLDYTTPLVEMKLKEDTKNILAVIYFKYWCEESKKTEFLSQLKTNEIRFQEEMREKYNPDKIFENQNIQSKEIGNLENTNMQLIEYKKEGIFKKIINNLKNFFGF